MNDLQKTKQFQVKIFISSIIMATAFSHEKLCGTVDRRSVPQTHHRSEGSLAPMGISIFLQVRWETAAVIIFVMI